MWVIYVYIIGVIIGIIYSIRWLEREDIVVVGDMVGVMVLGFIWPILLVVGIRRRYKSMIKYYGIIRWLEYFNIWQYVMGVVMG